jgi:hypothetical protein
MDHSTRMLAAAFHQIWNTKAIVLYPQGGLFVPQAERFRQGPDCQLVPFFQRTRQGGAFFGLLKGGVGTGLFGQEVEGGAVFHPKPRSFPWFELDDQDQPSPFVAASDDPTSAYLLGFTLSERAPSSEVGSTALGQDIERLTMGMALSALGLVEGKIRAVLEPVVAPFYGPCTLPPRTLRFHQQGCLWAQEPDTSSVGDALDRALPSLMAAHGIKAGHLAVAPSSHFKGHMLLAIDSRRLSAHARMEAIALWRHHSA